MAKWRHVKLEEAAEAIGEKAKKKRSSAKKPGENRRKYQLQSQAVPRKKSNGGEGVNKAAKYRWLKAGEIMQLG